MRRLPGGQRVATHLHPGLSGTTAIRTVAGQSFGRALAEAPVEAEAYMVGVARDRIGAPELVASAVLEGRLGWQHSRSPSCTRALVYHAQAVRWSLSRSVLWRSGRKVWLSLGQQAGRSDPRRGSTALWSGSCAENVVVGGQAGVSGLVQRFHRRFVRLWKGPGASQQFGRREPLAAATARR